MPQQSHYKHNRRSKPTTTTATTTMTAVLTERATAHIAQIIYLALLFNWGQAT